MPTRRSTRGRTNGVPLDTRSTMVIATPRTERHLMSEFRDRIKELRRVPAKDLVVNEKNWREHDTRQKDAMLDLLSEVGYADALVAYELPDGRLKLVNGHMRAGLTPEHEVPVLVLDVTEDEADKLLATFDPVSSFASTNKEKLKTLLDSLKINNHDMRNALSRMAADGGQKFDQSMQAKMQKKQAEQILEMELKPLEHYDYIIVMARNVMDWNRLVDLFRLEKTRKPTSSAVGVCRAVDAKVLLDMLQKHGAPAPAPAPAPTPAPPVAEAPAPPASKGKAKA
jgi:hypothetical protein